MKIKLLSLCTFGLLAFAGMKASAQFTIDSFTIAGGGGTSTGGAFALSGTIGQPDAGTMSGGNYSLAGGFWGAIPTPSPGPTVIKLWIVRDEVHLRFNGIPGRVYDIERARFVTGPWRNGQPFASITMPSDGVVEFVDTTGVASQFFYRTSTR
jgi:hypothetical protein